MLREYSRENLLRGVGDPEERRLWKTDHEYRALFSLIMCRRKG